MIGLDRTIRLPFTYYFMYKKVKYQRKFICSYLYWDLEKFKRENDHSLDEQDFRKITHYYGLGVPAILGESFCILRESEMTLKERLASTYQGAMTGLFDDFFDKKDISLGQIIEILDNPYKHEGTTAIERLFLHYYRKALENADSQNYVKKSLFDVYEAQVDSKKQTSPLLSNDEIHDITFRKGGLSLLFYRGSFSHSMDRRELKMLYLMGGMMQLGNDIFDVYKDSKTGIRTLVTNAKHISHIRLLLKKCLKEWKILVDELNYPEQNREAFKRFVTLGMSRCFVCLDQLESLEIKTFGVFSPSIYSRDELICDMEKTGNIVKALMYYLTLL